ncbi:MAG: N-acetyl-alpha-D-glucosaminyl L-malate synthase BshA [Candidatus Aminicenantes bacterium]|nr:N-acetyl-alpha-D-glucosaminyl L-malate synthase BshA [Candidatus Aminicenantes bacterium]
MNVAILNYHRIGGSGIVAYEIGRSLAEERGHRVHFIGLEPPFRLRDNFLERITFHKVEVKEYPVFDYQPYALALASQLSEIILENDIQVIHSHYALPHAVAALLARDISGRKVKCVTTLHGTDITIVGAHPSMMNITRYAIKNSDLVTAVSNSLRRETEEKLGIEKGKIRTIYNFVNTRDFNPGLKKIELAHCKDRTMILHISNLRPVKAPLDVIKIFHGILQRVDLNLGLCILGEGPMQSGMMRLARDLEIEDRVNFLGAFNDLGPVIVSSRLMLLPSLQESFGLVALESMACGVPVVASRVGGLPEVIEDGINSCLFESGNLDEAIEKSVDLLNDQKGYLKMSQQAVKTATKTFSQEKIILQYESVYQ